MPIKIVAGVAIVATVAVGLVVYENREQIREFADRSRQKIADLLRRLADELELSSSEEEAIPMAGRPFSPLSFNEISPNEMRSPNNPFANPPQQQLPVVTGRDYDTGHMGHLRLRGAGTGGGSDASSHLAPVVNENRATTTFTSPIIVSSPLSATIVNSDNLPPQIPTAADELASESGYDTARQPLNDEPTVHQPRSQSSRTISNADGVTEPEDPFQNPQQPFWSIHEWQENATQAAPAGNDILSSLSLVGSAEDELESISDLASEFGSEEGSEHGSWTEVASEFSDDHMV